MDPSISIHDSSFQPPLPLTRENLMNFQDTMEQKDSVANEILQRYCHDIHQWRQPASRERCQSSPPQPDVVVASPRVLPFPYHNDSMFLPTAEQIQYRHLHSSAVSSSTSRADLSSIPPESEYFISRPHSTTTTTNMHSNHSLSSFPWERRSLPTRLDHKFIISKSNKQPRFLRRSSSFASNSTLNNNEETKKPWLKRVMKFFNKGSSRKTAKKEDENIDQVWYCQYSKNPSTRFENYYQQQQVISVS